MISATHPSGFPRDARSAAERYIAHGLAPIPIPLRSKKPGFADWQRLRVDAESLDRYFPLGQESNIGVLNGLGNVADVDLDCVEALRVAPLLLPTTGWIFGRATAPRSHWLFLTDVVLDTAALTFDDPDGGRLVELRGAGGQTVYPPSLHQETGERIAWDRFTEPGRVALDDLRRAVGEVAAAALLARHWPAKGSRDVAAMALTGALVRAGWDEEHVARFVEAVAVAAGDDEVRMRAGKASSTAAKLDNGRKTTGWPSLMKVLGERGRDIVERVREWLGLADMVPAELPIPAEVPWPEPLAAEAYHGIAGEIVRTIEPHSEADPAAILFQLLVGVGNIIGREVYYQVEADRHHANEFICLVGRTSKARKGSSWGHVRYLLTRVEERWTTERVQSGLSSGEGLIWAVRDPITSLEKTKEGGEIKYVEVPKDPGIEDKRLLIHEPEFANVLKQVERQGNTLSVILRQAWDGGQSLKSMTKNSPACATGAHVSLVGHVTTTELRRLLSATETANGFANRIMWVGAERSKLLPEGGHLNPQLLDEMASRVAELLAKVKDRGRIRRDDECRDLWAKVYGELSEGQPGMSGALLARAEAHVMRLSMLYAVLDGSEAVGVPHLMAALALWNYVEQTVRHVFGDALGDPIADDLLHLLRASPNGLTRNELREYFNRNLSSDRIGRALALLLQARLVRCEKQSSGGRPTERWFAQKRTQER